MFGASSMSTKSKGDFNEADMHCSIAKSNALIYSRNFDQSRTIREHNLHQNFAYLCEDHYVYGVLTGFESIEAVRYYTSVLSSVLSQNIQKLASQRKQSLLTTTNSQQIDQSYSQLLTDAFATVEEQFQRLKADALSEKAVLDYELQGNLPENYPIFNDRIKELSTQLSAGLSAVVAFIHERRLYIANIGDTRAILCRRVLGEDGEGCIVSSTLSVTHDLDNLSELRRLGQLGLNTNAIRQKREIGNMMLTRCLGNLWLKKFYKDYADLADATDDPIIATPDITTFALDESCLFLILASSSLLEALAEATSKKDITEDLVKMVNEEFQNCQQPSDVAQAVVNQIRQLHYSGYGQTTCRQIEDITLLVRDLTTNEGSGSQLSSGQTTPTNLTLGNPLPRLSISIENENGSTINFEEPSSSRSNTIDADRTITDHMANISLSEHNLADDGTHAGDDEKEIDAYVDFTVLLEAYNEKNETKAAD